jgi:hypothetical protein
MHNTIVSEGPDPKIGPASDAKKGYGSTLHGFSPKLAERYGLVAAVIYPYLRWLIVIKGKGRSAPSLSDLKKTYPYLGRDQIWRALEDLSVINEEAFYEQGTGYPALLERSRVGTGYSYRLDFEPATEKHHYFDPLVAKKYSSIVAAVVYDNLMSWILRNCDDDIISGGQPYHYESPKKWQEAHPYTSLATVKRAFRALIEGKEIIHLTDGLMPGDGKPVYYRRNGHRAPVWTIPFDPAKVDRWMRLHKKGKYSKEAIEREKAIAVRANKHYENFLFDPDC